MKTRYALIPLLASLPVLALADAYSSPRELMTEMAQLQSGPCDFHCQVKVADMYSAQHLKGLRSVVMFGLRNEAHRQQNMLIFFGEEIPMDKLEAMSDQEFFARQLLYREDATPADIRFTQSEIISEKQISDTEIQMLVEWSGLAAKPSLKEQGYMTFVKQDNGWKIKH